MTTLAPLHTNNIPHYTAAYARRCEPSSSAMSQYTLSKPCSRVEEDEEEVEGVSEGQAAEEQTAEEAAGD